MKTKAAEPLIDSDFEYRVIEAGAIENIYYDPITAREGRLPVPETLFSYFGKEKVFRYEANAWARAEQKEEACLVLEHGVCVLDHSDIIFPSHLTDADVVAYEKRLDKKMEQVRKLENAAMEARREAAIIWLVDAQKNVRAENGGTFVPHVAYGSLKVNGVDTRGSMSWDKEGRSYFLPDNWNERQK